MCFPQIRIQVSFYNASVGGPPYDGEREIGGAMGTIGIDFTEAGANPETVSAESGSADITTWDFIAQEVAGSATATLMGGREIAVTWEVDGEDLE